MRILLASVLIVGFASAAFANDAGCGLGSLIIQKNSKLSQLFAITTNATFSSQVFGITTGTSNCSASGLVYNYKEATVYAEANMPSLKVEMARGEGENLSAFAQTMGCHDSAAFGKMTKTKYQTIFPSSDVDAHQMLSNVRTEIEKDPSLKQICPVAG